MDGFKKYARYQSDSHVIVNTEAVMVVDVADDGSFTNLTVFGVEDPIVVDGDVSSDFFRD